MLASVYQSDGKNKHTHTERGSLLTHSAAAGCFRDVPASLSPGPSCSGPAAPFGSGGASFLLLLRQRRPPPAPEPKHTHTHISSAHSSLDLAQMCFINLTLSHLLTGSAVSRTRAPLINSSLLTRPSSLLPSVSAPCRYFPRRSAATFPSLTGRPLSVHAAVRQPVTTVADCSRAARPRQRQLVWQGLPSPRLQWKVNS